MWIKSLYDSVWVNMQYITHFTTETDSDPHRRGNHLLYAHLNTSGNHRWGHFQNKSGNKIKFVSLFVKEVR